MLYFEQASIPYHLYYSQTGNTGVALPEISFPYQKRRCEIWGKYCHTNHFELGSARHIKIIRCGALQVQAPQPLKTCLR